MDFFFFILRKITLESYLIESFTILEANIYIKKKLPFQCHFVQIQLTNLPVQVWMHTAIGIKKNQTNIFRRFLLF